MRLNRFMIRPLVEAGLREELNAGDTTGGFLIWDDDPVQTAQIYAKGHGIACLSISSTSASMVTVVRMASSVLGKCRLEADGCGRLPLAAISATIDMSNHDRALSTKGA